MPSEFNKASLNPRAMNGGDAPDRNCASAARNSRLQRVLVYVEQNAQSDLNLEKLSRIAAFSKHHFHRRFSAQFGFTAQRYVQLLRLKRASFRIAFRERESITQIALDSGYEHAEAFSRAFRKRVGQTPTDFRRHPAWAAWHHAFALFSEVRRTHLRRNLTDADVRIVEFPETRVGILQHRGDLLRTGESLRRFISWRRKEGLHPAKSATFNVLHAAPDARAEDVSIDLCAAIEHEVAPNDAGISQGFIRGGRCAVLRLTGSDDHMRTAILFLLTEWLPRSGEALRDAPVFVQRLTFFPDVCESEAVSDVFLPLKG